MRLDQVGEFGLINRLERIVHLSSDRIVCGIGDDAAVIRNRPGDEIVLTTDALIEGVHFDLAYTPMKAIGWKALAASLSDIAAMGAVPICAVVSIAIPTTWSVENVEKMYSGLAMCGKRFGCPVVGGDTTCSHHAAFLCVTVEGEIQSGKAILRSGAKTGDLLCITGELGGARTGFEVLTTDGDRKQYSKSIQRLFMPIPRLREASELVKGMPITSMIDISDGLGSEICHLCKQSDVGCLIDEDVIPVTKETIHWAKKTNQPLSRYIYESGEEYELLFTIPKEVYENRRPCKPSAGNRNFSVIGEIKRAVEGVRIRRGKKILPLESTGWDHFGRGREQL